MRGNRLHLHRLAASREEVNQPRDQLVERRAFDSTEIAVAHETPPIAEPEEKTPSDSTTRFERQPDSAGEATLSLDLARALRSRKLPTRVSDHACKQQPASPTPCRLPERQGRYCTVIGWVATAAAAPL
jgi:hypothetical protein